MKPSPVLDEKRPSFSEIFTEYLSDISLEVEAIKSRNMRKDEEVINEHLARIENSLKGIMYTKLALVEYFADSQTQN